MSARMKSPRQAAPRVLVNIKKPKPAGEFNKLCDDLAALRAKRTSKVKVLLNIKPKGQRP